MIESFLPWLQIIKCPRVMFLQINHSCASVMQILNMWEIRHDMEWANSIQTLETAFAKIYDIRLFLYYITIIINKIHWGLGSVGLIFYYMYIMHVLGLPYQSATDQLAWKPEIYFLSSLEPWSCWMASSEASLLYLLPVSSHDLPYMYLWLNFLF